MCVCGWETLKKKLGRWEGQKMGGGEARRLGRWENGRRRTRGDGWEAKRMWKLKSISYKYAFLSIIVTLFVIFMSSLPDRSYLGVSSATEQIVSNLAHIPAFALLTLLWLKTINLNGKGSFSHLFVLSGLALFAVLTEFLQSFVPGRTASFMDFGLDLIGILSGFLIIRLFGKTAF